MLEFIVTSLFIKGDVMVVVAAGIILFPSYTSELVYGIQYIGNGDNIYST